MAKKLPELRKVPSEFLVIGQFSTSEIPEIKQQQVVRQSTEEWSEQPKQLQQQQQKQQQLPKEIGVGMVRDLLLLGINVHDLRNEVKVFKGGCIGNHFKSWCRLTSDKNILSICTSGLLLNIQEDSSPCNRPFEYPRSKGETKAIDHVVRDLLSKRVIVPSNDKGGYFSNLFTTPKKDGTLKSQTA